MSLNFKSDNFLESALKRWNVLTITLVKLIAVVYLKYLWK